MFDGKRILIGIGGGIAVYRVAELARLLLRRGARVQCVMTRAAQAFVTPLTFEALTGETVYRELFDLTAEREMGHIRLARQADALLIAPATANQLAKYAHGICDDLLSTLVQVREGPLLIAPAMNVSMWQSAATRANVALLQQRGHRFVGPDSGELACGESGPGRLAGPEQIMRALWPLLTEQRLAGQRWLVNAGPTWERWDDVRILTNRAGGRLGVHIAEQAAAKGADVTLVAGPGTPQACATLRRIDVESAAEMLQACEREAGGGDVFIATAAVSDYRIAAPHAGKLKRGHSETHHLELAENPDIVARIAAMPERPKQVIAFAAERERHVDHARDKLRRKRVDAVIANDAGQMGGDHGRGWWVDGERTIELAGGDKAAFAAQIIQHIMENRQ